MINGDRGRDMILVLVGVRGCVAVDAGHSLVTLFSLSGRLRTDRCIRHRGQVIDLLSQAHTCVWVLGRLVALLSWVSALSGPTVRVSFWWRRSLHHTKFGTQGRGLGVLVWTGTWTPRIGGWWVSPACARGTSRACVFGVPSWGHWFANRRAIRYGLFRV